MYFKFYHFVFGKPVSGFLNDIFGRLGYICYAFWLPTKDGDLQGFMRLKCDRSAFSLKYELEDSFGFVVKDLDGISSSDVGSFSYVDPSCKFYVNRSMYYDSTKECLSSPSNSLNSFQFSRVISKKMITCRSKCRMVLFLILIGCLLFVEYLLEVLDCCMYLRKYTSLNILFCNSLSVLQ